MNPRAKKKPENVDKKSKKNFEANLSTQGKFNFKMSMDRRNNSKFIFARPK
jgi:hypothetical protein